VANEPDFDYSVYASQAPQPSPLAPQAAAPDEFDYSVYASKPEAAPQSAKDRILERLKPMEKVRQTAAAGLRGFTLGTSDRIGAAGSAAGYNIGESMGLLPETGKELGQHYSEDLARTFKERDDFRETNPALAYGGEIVGAIAPAFVTGGAALAPAAGTLATIGRGAALGMGQGALYAGSQANEGEVIGDAGKGALIGAALGGAIPAVIKGGGAIVSAMSKDADTFAAQKAVDAVRGAAKSDAAASDDLVFALKQRGIDFADLPPDIKSTVVAEFNAASGLGSKLSVNETASIVNQARLDKMPIPARGTKGELTGDYIQQRREGIVAASPVIGKRLNDKLVQENQNSLAANFENIAARTKGASKNADEAGDDLSAFVNKREEDSMAGVRSLYKSADEKEGGKIVDVSRELSDWFKSNSAKNGAAALEQKAGNVGALKGSANNDMRLGASGMLESVSDGVPLKNLYDLRKSATAMTKSPDTIEAGREIRAIIDNAFEQHGGDMYKAAASARNKHGEVYERGRSMVADIIANKGKTVDKRYAESQLFTHAIMKGKATDIDGLFSFLLEKGPMRKEGVQIVRNLRKQAVDTMSDAASPNGVFTDDKLTKAIKAIGGEKKFESLFGKEGKMAIDNFREGAKVLLRKAPSPLSGSQTTSNASIIMGDFLSALQSISPGGPLTKSIISGGVKSNISSNALSKQDPLLVKFISKERQARNAAANKLSFEANQAIRGGQRTLTSDNN